VDGIGIERPERDEVIETYALHGVDAETRPCLLKQHPTVRRERGALVLHAELDANHAQCAAVRGDLTVEVRGVEVPTQVIRDLLESGDLGGDVPLSGHGQARPHVHGRARLHTLDLQGRAGVKDAAADLVQDVAWRDGRLALGVQDRKSVV
jgi:hypothetical protein